MVVDRMPGEAGDQVTFSEVLLSADGENVQVGAPLVSGVSVQGKIVEQGRLPKVTGVKMKAKKRHMKYFGHKQHITQVEIESIEIKK